MSEETAGITPQETPVSTETPTPTPEVEATVQTAKPPEYTPRSEEPTVEQPTVETAAEQPTVEAPPTTEEVSTQETTDDQAQPDVRVVPKATEYKIPEGVPEQMGEIANKLGYTQEQLDGTLQQFAPVMQAAKAQELEALKQEGIKHLESWGDQKDHKLNIAQSALRQFDPEGEMIEALNTSGFRHAPVVMDFLYRVGEGAKEGGFLSTASQNPGKQTMAKNFFPSMKQA